MAPRAGLFCAGGSKSWATPLRSAGAALVAAPHPFPREWVGACGCPRGAPLQPWCRADGKFLSRRFPAHPFECAGLLVNSLLLASRSEVGEQEEASRESERMETPYRAQALVWALRRPTGAFRGRMQVATYLHFGRTDPNFMNENNRHPGSFILPRLGEAFRPRRPFSCRPGAKPADDRDKDRPPVSCRGSKAG